MKKEFRPQVLTFEDAYPLIQKYVNYNWNKYHSLRDFMEKEDAVQEIINKFQEKDYYAQYNPEGTTAKNFIAVAVGRWFIDKVRYWERRRGTSLQKPIAEDLTLEEIISDNEYSTESVFGAAFRDKIIQLLPGDTESNVVVDSPILENSKFSLRNVALLLEYGFKPNEICEMCKNPYSGNPVSLGTITKIIRELRETTTEVVKYLNS